MKNKFIISLLGFVFSAGIASSQDLITHYTHSFSGPAGSYINGVDPEGGVNTGLFSQPFAHVQQNGVGSGGEHMTYLPFSIVAGRIYTYELQMNPTSGTGYIGMGFASAATGTTLGPGGQPNYYAWWYQQTAGNTNTVGGTGVSGTSNIAGPNASGLRNFKVVLNTLGNYKAQFFLDGTLVRTADYTTNPAITHIMFGGYFNPGVYDNLSLTSVPEPSAALLGAFGALALLRRRRA